MLAVERFRLPEVVHGNPKGSPDDKTQRRRRKGSFLKGPISINWLSVAGALPGKTLHVALAIQFAYGFEKHHRFRFTAKWYDWLEIGPHALRASLQRLKKAGLIRLEFRPGCAPIVTILEVPEVKQ